MCHSLDLSVHGFVSSKPSVVVRRSARSEDGVPVFVASTVCLRRVDRRSLLLWLWLLRLSWIRALLLALPRHLDVRRRLLSVKALLLLQEGLCALLSQVRVQSSLASLVTTIRRIRGAIVLITRLRLHTNAVGSQLCGLAL